MKSKYEDAFDYTGWEPENSPIFSDYRSLYDKKSDLEKERERLEIALVKNLESLDPSRAQLRSLKFLKTIGALNDKLYADQRLYMTNEL